MEIGVLRSFLTPNSASGNRQNVHAREIAHLEGRKKYMIPGAEEIDWRSGCHVGLKRPDLRVDPKSASAFPAGVTRRSGSSARQLRNPTPLDQVGTFRLWYDQADVIIFAAGAVGILRIMPYSWAAIVCQLMMHLPIP